MFDRDILLSRLFFDGGTRAKVWRKLAAQTRHDMGLIKSLSMAKERFAMRSGPSAVALSGVLGRIIQGLHAGLAFDKALAPFVPEEEVMLIEGGLKSNRLPEALSLCADLIKARQRIVSSLVEAISYPVLLFILFLILLVVLSLHVMPQLAVLSDPHTWSGGAYILWRISDFVASIWGASLLALIIAIFIGSLVSLPVWTGPMRLKVENIPPWSFYRLIVGSIWLFTVSTLMQGGTQLSHILENMLKNDLSPWLVERITAIRAEYALGKDLGSTLADTGLNFPDAELIDDLCAYAELPGFDSHLHSLASEWLDEGVERIAMQARVLNAICLCGMLGLLCGLALAVVSLQEQLTTTGGF